MRLLEGVRHTAFSEWERRTAINKLSNLHARLFYSGKHCTLVLSFQVPGGRYQKCHTATIKSRGLLHATASQCNHMMCWDYKYMTYIIIIFLFFYEESICFCHVHKWEKYIYKLCVVSTFTVFKNIVHTTTCLQGRIRVTQVNHITSFHFTGCFTSLISRIWLNFLERCLDSTV